MQRVFGGQVAGQALVAAARTVDADDGAVHSLHAYFLRPGDPTVPILYEVDRIRDGRSFTTRRVVAIQHGKAIFNLQRRFHAAEPGIEHQAPMPDDVPDARVAAHVQGALGAPRRGARRVVHPAPAHRLPQRRLEPRRPRARRCRPASGCGSGPPGTLPDDPILHTCVLTYASDMTLLDTTAAPPRRRVRRGAS